MLHPSDFQVNEAWILFRLNESPISTEQDGDFNVIALMDAASCYILGAEFVSLAYDDLSELEAKRLIKNAKSHHHRLPKTLYVAENQVADIICAEVERNGSEVIRVPEEALLVFIGEARSGLPEHLGGAGSQ